MNLNTENLKEKLFINKTTNESDIEYLAKFRGLRDFKDNIDVDAFLEKYFSKDSVGYQEEDHQARNDKWAKCFAGNPIWGFRVNPLKLEPFVARYVNALNYIGAKTCSSCDGWHEYSKNKLFVEFKDRYSMIWHKIMCGRLLTKNVKWTYDCLTANLKLPKSDDGKIDIYIKLNKNAEEFENLQRQLLTLKSKVIAKMKNKVKTPLSNEEIEAWMRRVIQEVEQE